jgi:hypothetical protein
MKKILVLFFAACLAAPALKAQTESETIDWLNIGEIYGRDYYRSAFSLEDTGASWQPGFYRRLDI